MIDCSELKKGKKIEIEGVPYVITQFEFVKPGKGQALYKCKLKNMISRWSLEANVIRVLSLISLLLGFEFSVFEEVDGLV